MIGLADDIAAYLAANPTLATIASGGIYSRPIKAGRGPNATPDVFLPDPSDPARLPQIRPAIVILDGGEVPVNEAISLMETFPRVFYFAQDTTAGRNAIERMDLCTRFLLTRLRIQTSGARPASYFSILERTEIIPSDDHPNAIYVFRRFRAEYVQEGTP